MKEMEIRLKLVEPYLRDLGYRPQAIRYEVRTEAGRFADMVVWGESGPWLVVEVKRFEGLQIDTDPIRLRFDPHVRQVQSYALDLGAPYYLLTDGKSYLWFTTDAEGRPELLEEPIRPTEELGDGTGVLSREAVTGVLWKLAAYLQSEALALTSQTEVIGFIILARLLEERGDDRLRTALCTGQELESPLQIAVVPPLWDWRIQTCIPNAFEIVSKVSLTNASPKDLLGALDETVRRTLRRDAQHVERWLADFLVELSQLRPGSNTLIMGGGYGNLLAAVGMRHQHADAATGWAIVHSQGEALWTTLQQAVLGLPCDRVIVGQTPPYDVQASAVVPPPSFVLAVPPMGRRIRDHETNMPPFEGRVAWAEDLFLELALSWAEPAGRVVMLVPEALLFQGGTRVWIRKLILEQAHATAIIGLPAGALHPQSSIRSSVLVLDKRTAGTAGDTFMSAVKEFKPKTTFNSRDIAEIQTLLEEFELWSRDQELSLGTMSWVVSEGTLRDDNLTVTRYMPSEIAGYEDLVAPYPMVSLESVAEVIRRGVSIRLDEDGDIVVLGPAAIRPMVLDNSKLGRTSEEGLLGRRVQVMPGDVVVNSIGTHLGSAAVVDEPAGGSYTSQHVIAIRPDTARVLPMYLAAALNSDYVQPQIERRVVGAAMRSLSIGRLRDITLPLPSLESQRRIVAEIERARDDMLRKQDDLRRAEKAYTDILRHLSVGGGVER